MTQVPAVAIPESAQLSGTQHLAAYLVAQDKLKNDDIAKECDVAKRTLQGWKLLPEFRKVVEAHRDAFYQGLLTNSIADGRLRLRVQNDRWQRMRRFVSHRASDEKYVGRIPGYETGWVCVKLKPQRDGPELEEYAFDTGLAAAMDAIEQHAATDLGQWKTKIDVDANVKVSATAVALASVLQPEELAQLKAKFEAARGPVVTVQAEQPGEEEKPNEPS